MMRIIKYIIYSIVGASILLVFGYLGFSFVQEPYELTDKVRAISGGQFVKLQHGYVRYELKGPDTGKVIVLVHGAGSGYYAWDHNYDALVSQGFRVLRYDLYGRGYSDRPHVDYDIGLFRGQLEQLLDTLQLNKNKLSFVGVSMGATIAIDYTSRHKQQVAHLVLVDPASLGMGVAPWYIRKPLISDLLFTFYWRPRAVDRQMKEFFDETKVASYRPKTEDQMKYVGFKRAIRSTWIHTLGLDMSSAMKDIAISEVPTHLIWGKYDPLIPYAASKQYIKLMPQSSLD
ncbi:MAG TPA: alpha/beta hydrolase, partial [Cytophagales bacterium]|nr:alpha/beta hydrolase [Cytophagales bacterium]